MDVEKSERASKDLAFYLRIRMNIDKSDSCEDIEPHEQPFEANNIDQLKETSFCLILNELQIYRHALLRSDICEGWYQTQGYISGCDESKGPQV